MDIDKLNKWADLLLDTGKRNNLINFKDAKMGTVEVVYPTFSTLFSKAEHSAIFEVYDPKLYDDEDEEELSKDKRLTKEEYIARYDSKVKKNKQVLIYNAFVNPIKALNNIGKKARTAIEETGVNIAYMAFGFINWTESDNPLQILRAPILLAPISIENDSAIDPYHIKITDSDIIVNPTFSFKLKNDFGIELPDYDEENIDEYLLKIEELISKLKWTITKECKIGIFSFLKINMHKDLKENAPKILKNKGVRSLLGEENINFATDESTSNKPKQFYNVVDADSSQTEAIEMAKSGKSFVLQGPPGTGKSQTITNIIAECLAGGKKVLFVSEKLAALSVVYDKLKKAGLEEFCLELHSHKANKKDVINELCHTLKKQRSVLSDRAQKEIDFKINAQKDLDDYALEVHKERPTINKTLYQLYEEVSACRNAPTLEFVIKDINLKGEEYINEFESALSRYMEFTSSVGEDYYKNAFYGYADTDYSYQNSIGLKDDLTKSIVFCQGVRELLNKTNEKYSINAKNITQTYSVKEFFNFIKSTKFITPNLLNFSSLPNIMKKFKEMQSVANEILTKKKIIDGVFDEDIYNLDGRTTYKKLSKQFNNIFTRIFSSEYIAIAKELKLCNKTGKRVKYNTALSMMDTLRIYQQKQVEFSALEKELKDKLSDEYDGVNTNFAQLILEIDALMKLSFKDLAYLKTFSNQKFIDSQKDFEYISNCFDNLFNDFEQVKDRIESKFSFDGYSVVSVKIENLLNKFTAIIENFDKLDNWCEFIKLLNKLKDLDLREYIDKTINQKIQPKNILLTYKKAFYSQWIDLVLHQSPTLIRLSRIPHDETVNLFKTKDKLNFEINKAKIKVKLSALRPSLDMVAQGSAISILLREGEKKRKQKAIRPLLEEIGELAQTLKPCFLMSPLSVSTFLNSDINFDVVIFDEASQIFPQDAIGAIYRGKQLIVVGDSKQMPPSNFFNSSSVQEDSDDEVEDIADFESILDICSTSFPQKRLKWHYRSRFEPLISFSNKNFYDDDLVTFPSSMQDTKGIGVDYYHVDGTFDRQTKTNLIEAQKVVDLVFEHIQKYPDRSLGVVAFSISQQNLIDKLLAKRRKLDPSKEVFFKADREEPFFVKNLETVQGDERDTIIFSVAYGRDPQGRLLLNFGPINRDGGERRLNVAVTRAKYNIQLVSSMHYTDIDLSRTQSVGARLLREYLDYAENGLVALKRTSLVNAFEQKDCEFENEVKDFLLCNGFEVDSQLGSSSCKIDLAVKEHNSSNYLVAIECDGDTYNSSKSVRDRDRLRQEILERMGWNYYRIWSTDWFRNKTLEKDRLLKFVKKTLQSSNRKFKNESSLNDISFEETAKSNHFEFPKYQMADEYKLAEQLNFDKPKIINAIVDLEAPISEEWLLKRLAFLFGREKVTSAVRDEFNYIIRHSSSYKFIRKNGFFYSMEKDIPMLRVPEENATTIREVKNIAMEELALGMKEILKQNISVEKSGLFRLLVNQLGFARIGDATLDYLEDALTLIAKEIEFNGDILSLK